MTALQRALLLARAESLGGKGSRLAAVAGMREAAFWQAHVEALEADTGTKDWQIESKLADAATLERDAAYLRIEAWILAKEGGW
jgi:hypothetical protein